MPQPAVIEPTFLQVNQRYLFRTIDKAIYVGTVKTINNTEVLLTYVFLSEETNGLSHIIQKGFENLQTKFAFEEFVLMRNNISGYVVSPVI